MANTTDTNTAAEAVLKSFLITVPAADGVGENVVKISPYTPDKGRGQGITKLIPDDFQVWDLDKVVTIWGKDKVFKHLLKPRLSQIFSNFTREATTKITIVDGKEVESVETDPAIVEKEFAEMFRVLSQRGETLTALTKRLNEIETEELPKLMEIMQKVMFEDLVLPDNEKAALKAQTAALREERAELKKSIAEKKSKRSSSEDEGEEKEAVAA